MVTKTGKWKRTGSGKLTQSLPCGGMILIRPDGAWDLCFPNGTHATGVCESVAAAQEQWREPYNAFVIRAWSLGKVARGGGMLCPLD